MINYGCRTCKNFKEDLWCAECNYEFRLPDNVVHVVRCKNCKHIKEEHFNIMPDGFSCELSGLMVEPEHYCSYGERAEA